MKPVVELGTDVPGVVLRRLTAADAGRFWNVLQDNAAFVDRMGDHGDELAETVDGFAQRFGNAEDLSSRYGIVLHGDLVGHVAVIHREPPRFGLGYWLAEHATGRGIATAAVRAALDHAHSHMRAEEVLAGVTHGNDKSVAVLVRLGFREVEDFETYTRFGVTLPLAPRVLR